MTDRLAQGEPTRQPRRAAPQFEPATLAAFRRVAVDGIAPAQAYRERTCRLVPGDQLVFYTDGITEAQDERGEMFGLSRLDRVLENCAIGASGLLESVLEALEPYCSGFLWTYVDKEGMMQGTDLDWFRRLRAATSLELTAAGGITTLDEVRALADMNVHAALGMAIYTGRLRLDELARIAAG